MFQFTTTTVINALKDFTTGKDLIDAGEGYLTIKRVNPFKTENIKSVYKTAGHEGKADVVKIDLTKYMASDKVKADTRIGLYIRSVGNADPMYANDLVFKGKPLYIELPKDTAKEKIVEVTNKYMNLVFGGELQLLTKMDGNKLVLTCVNEYQRVTKVTIATRSTDPTLGGEYLFGDGQAVENAVTPGTEGFGTYDQLIKDLRLPTSANLRWKRTMEDEMPTPGALYTEYVLTYSVNRGIMGISAVGSEVTSRTTHVFWVKSDLVSQFDAKLEAAGLSKETLENDSELFTVKAPAPAEEAGSDVNNTL